MKQENLKIYIKYFLLALPVVGTMATFQIHFILDLPFGPRSFMMPFMASLLITFLAGRIHVLKEKVAQAAFIDPLTGLLNRRSFYERVTETFAAAKRYQSGFSFILLDIDNFKKINDTFGHLTGDEVLKKIGSILDSLKRETDYTARWGGEEFVLLLPNTSLDGAAILAEKVRNEISQSSFPGADRVTCSFGVTTYQENFENSNELVYSADIALYKAKNNGKNRVEIASVAPRESSGKKASL